ncbi:MAG: RecX family transcriptional regulator [Bacteroidetes bacterium]|nr:RecX family transcriptional regulator [Bacteroidota bacterium]
METVDILPSPGIISDVEAQKKSPDRCSVFIEGEFAFCIHADLVVSEGLFKGRRLDQDALIRLLEEDAYLRAREKTYRFLSYRPRSENEIRNRLKQKGFGSLCVDRVIARLRELGLIDDLQFAASFAAARIRSKGFGPSRIRSELRAKGISSEIIEKTVEDAFAGVTLDDLALQTAEKIRPRLERVSDPRKRRRKLEDYLRRRGFSFDEIRTVSHRFGKK